MANQQRNENNTSYLFYSFSLSLFSLAPNERRAYIYIYIHPETHLNITLTVRFKVFIYEILSFTYPMSGIIKKERGKMCMSIIVQFKIFPGSILIHGNSNIFFFFF